MNAVLYSRVSSKGQEEEGFSLAAQEKTGLAYAEQNNLTIVKSWSGPESAWRDERRNFNQLIEYVKRHKDIGHVIFDVTDRMTRNDFDKVKVISLIKDYDKTIHFARSKKVINKSSGSEDEFMLDIEVAVAKKMSNDISRKTSMGMQEKAEQGTYPSSAPIGYLNIVKTSDSGEIRTLALDDSRASLIAKMFKLYSSGNYSYQQVADAVNQDGLRTKNEKKITKATTEVILKNPIYYGGFVWKRKLYNNGKHEPIITKELFDLVQDIIRGHNRPLQKKHSFPYVGLMTCGRCGCAITAEIKKKRYIYYHCTSAKGKCGNQAIRQELLEEKFADYIKALSIGEERLNAVKISLKGRFQDEKAIRHANITRLKTQYTQLQNRLDKMYIDNLDNKIDTVFYERNKNDWQAQQKEIKLQLERYENQDLDYIEQGIKILELANRAYPLYLRQSAEERRILLNVLLSNCVLNDGTPCAAYRKPFDIIAEGLSRQIWLPDVDGSRTPQIQYCQLLVKVYSRRTKRFELSIDQPFPTPTPQPVKSPKNIVKIALDVKAYTEVHPGHSYSLVAENFNVSRARISQLLKIIDNLPTDFITKLQETEDPIMLRRFSGKRLLKIASFQTRKNMESAIEALMPL